MRITSSHIIEWVNTHSKDAQVNLSLMVRRLCYDPKVTRQMSFPAGDSTYIPGWDGLLCMELGTAWIPSGPSRWEIGCDKNIERKANKEYSKRTEQTGVEERSKCTFVFVTPRRWVKKLSWVAERSGRNEWLEVRAYDADDLEQWLEQTPAVALQFAESLGLVGPGVVSLSRYWDSWSKQCSPIITADALFMDRSSTREELVIKIQTAVSQSEYVDPLVLRADSVEEAAAFAVACTMQSGDLQDHSLVVTDMCGWQYVEANPQLKIAISARTETAAVPVLRKGLLVIVPRATGDWGGKPKGDELILERPNISEFEKALIAIGMEESDSRRFALIAGRSWTVLRRQKATNPAIQHPAWLDVPQSSSLSLLCILGSWHADKEADRQIVARLAGRAYEDIERDLLQLLRQDDSPILSIGTVWKAKSPLELFSQCGNQITSDQLDRFFLIIQEVLATPDPQLDLPNSERWLANVHGKVHPYSELLVESACDSLIKMAVRGPEQTSLIHLNIEVRVDRLISELLDGADDKRWLSLHSHLAGLAEAAPNAFLRAVEDSLQLPNVPVTKLIVESGALGLMGCCWHAELLWALEILAWAPNRLARVAKILAKLSHVQMAGNWSNKPSESLFGLFRSWYPQTSASLAERVKVLDLLIQQDQEVAFDVLKQLLADGTQTATSAARPKWREDDAGAGHGALRSECRDMLRMAQDRVIQISAGNASRIAQLLENTILCHRENLSQVLFLIDPFTCAEASDEDRVKLLTALRRILHWHRNYGETSAPEFHEWLSALEVSCERMSPRDVIIRHCWLFDKHWPDLPFRNREENVEDAAQVIEKTRVSAITEIHHEQGLQGVEKLITRCQEPVIVGSLLAAVVWDDVCWPEWIASKGVTAASDKRISQCLAGYLQMLSPAASRELLQKVIVIGKNREWEVATFSNLLILARCERGTWVLAESCGSEVFSAYWRDVCPRHSRNKESLSYVIERLLESKRPRTALQSCQYSVEQTPPQLLFKALQMLLQGDESEGPQIDSYHFDEILKWLEGSGEIDNTELIQLEFALIPVLGHGGTTKATALYKSVMSEPSLFAELISYAYKPAHNEAEHGERMPIAAAERAWQVFHACERLPGTQEDGSVDAAKFLDFIDTTRKLCLDADRLAVCDHTLGNILAHSPSEGDGTWPIALIRELLERADMCEMRSGFYYGALNKRGSTWRCLSDGGDQERDLAIHYRDMAVRVHCTQPNVAAMLEDIARNYESDGRRHDTEADLRKEGIW